MRIESHVPLQPRTTLQVGGLAEYFVTVTTKEELQEAARWAVREKQPVFFLGGGSNVLVPDAGVSGLTIHVNVPGITYEDDGDTVLVTAGAGEVFDTVVALTVDRGYWGLENLSHIPGCVGATPVQNIGAYGVEVKDVIESVAVYDVKRDQFRTLNNRECYFKYRDSLFKYKEGADLCVVSVTYRLAKQPHPQVTYKDLAARFPEDSTPTLAQIRAAIIEIRSAKFPDWTQVGTAGSFFKNPIVSMAEAEQLQAQYPALPMYEAGAGNMKVALGWILDHVCHLKGVREGAVGLYQNQALVLVQSGGATSDEVIAFAKKIERHVREATGIRIEWEVSLCS